MSFVRERERRANAGSRMRALLDQEVDMEELFEESDGEDEEFLTQAVEEEEDKVDSDFDLDSSDGEHEHIEEGRLMDKQLEKAEKKTRRVAFIPPPATTSVPKKPVERKKRKKVEETIIAEDEERGTRHSSRKNTMLNRLLVEDQLKEQKKRKALQTKKDRPVENSLSQEELLAEAAITEEKNKNSLLEWQQKEAERKENVKRKDKKGIIGPFVRYYSFADGKEIVVPDNTRSQNATDDRADLNMDDNDLMGRNLVTFVEKTKEEVIEQTEKSLELADLVNELSSWLEKSSKPVKPILCPITGEVAKYRDPKTLVPYANLEAYNIIRSCLNHEMNYTHSGLYLGSLPSADGVPEGWNTTLTKNS